MVKFSRWQIVIFFFFPENRIWHFMQIVSSVKSYFLGKESIFMKCQILFSRKNKKKYFKMLFAEIFT